MTIYGYFGLNSLFVKIHLLLYGVNIEVLVSKDVADLQCFR